MIIIFITINVFKMCTLLAYKSAPGWAGKWTKGAHEQPNVTKKNERISLKVFELFSEFALSRILLAKKLSALHSPGWLLLFSSFIVVTTIYILHRLLSYFCKVIPQKTDNFSILHKKNPPADKLYVNCMWKKVTATMKTAANISNFTLTSIVNLSKWMRIFEKNRKRAWFSWICLQNFTENFRSFGLKWSKNLLKVERFQYYFWPIHMYE